MKKFTKTTPSLTYEVFTDNSWEDIVSLHETIPYNVYELKTKSGLSLKCADNHIVFNKDMEEVFVINLKKGDRIWIQNDNDEVVLDKVESITDLEYEEAMYDLELTKGSKRRYFTNGILSHNTELGKALAEYLFDDETMLTRIDMSEYQQSHSAARMVGAPPGYVGYDEGGQLTEAARRKPYSVILLDEIEKAHPDVLNVLLQVLDDGRLTDNKGRVANFKNTIIIMTSNMGSEAIMVGIQRAEALKKSGKKKDEEFGTVEEIMEKAGLVALEMLKGKLRPEFLNRIDKTIVFDYLDKDNIKEIVKLQIEGLKKTLKQNGIVLEASEDAINKMTDMSYDPQNGARPVKRMIHNEILNRLSKDILSEKVEENSIIEIKVKDDQFIFENSEVKAKEKESV